MVVATGSGSVVEWIVLVIVVISTIGLNVAPSTEEVEEFEVSKLSGTIKLSTRASMDILGLEEFERGALATVDMEVHRVVSEGCTDCASTPTGMQLSGRVNITGLIDDDGRLGRIEAKLNITHLSEFQGDDFITREWVSIDWVAGDESTTWEMIVVHDPPKWKPNDRFRAAFIDVDEGMESRTGPWLLIHSLLDNSVNVHGCMPDSPTCRSTTTHDIDLNSTLKAARTPVMIQHLGSWSSLGDDLGTDETPTRLQEMRQQFSIGDEVEGHDYWCISGAGEVVSANSWQVTQSSSTTFWPMGIWLDALHLSSAAFSLQGKIWSEVDFADSSCASLVGEDDELRLGISVS